MSRPILATGTASVSVGTAADGTLEAVGLPFRPPVAGPVRVAMALVVGFFVLGGAWAGLAPLSSAAVSTGSLTVENNRKTVQHLEGGIIKDIKVKNGDTVAAGQTMVVLDDAQARANWQLVQGQHDALASLEARLVAERDQSPDVRFPDHLATRAAGDAAVKAMLDGQRTIFVGRREGAVVETNILRQRIEQLNEEIGSRQAQVDSAQRQVSLTKAEMRDVNDLMSRGLERRPRLLALQREEARLAGLIGEQAGLISAARQKIGEAELQINSLHSTRLNEVAAELRKTQNELGDMGERLRAARDVLDRRAIKAPIAGTVLNLRFFTSGGVIGPGLPILDIVPSEARLIIEGRMNQNDIANVRVGLPADIHLTAFKQRTTPTVKGRVIYVAADVTMDERTGQAFYMVRTEIPRSEIARLHGLDLIQGMAAQVMILTGDHTVLQYLVMPLKESFQRAFRER